MNTSSQPILLASPVSVSLFQTSNFDVVEGNCNGGARFQFGFSVVLLFAGGMSSFASNKKSLAMKSGSNAR